MHERKSERGRKENESERGRARARYFRVNFGHIPLHAGGFLDDTKKKLTPRTLSNLNLAQLQVIFNDLHTQIENYNELLLKHLEERDDLHMEQVTGAATDHIQEGCQLVDVS